MGTIAEEQFADVSPPRAGQTLALTLDATSRSYALATLAMGGHTPEGANTQRVEVFLCMQAETADAYYNFSSTGVTVNEATAVAAGGTLAYSNAHCAVLPAG